MTDVKDLVTKASNLDRTKLKAFVDHIAQFEAEARLKPKRVLINGIPPFTEIATVHFNVPREKLGASIEKLLASSAIKPSVLVNGVPAQGHFDLQVSFNGH